VDDIVIDGRFNGPPESANGGYAAGLVARLLGGGPVEVRLRLPPPLDRPLGWDGARLLDGEAVVAEGTAAAGAAARPPADLPAPVPVDDAAAASRGFPGRTDHPYPTCFGCGPQRAPGDGLRLSPGPVTGRDVVAAPWVPDLSLVAGDGIPLEVVWAALDCAGGWAGLPRNEGTFVLGTMRAAVTAPAAAGDPHVAIGWQIGLDGRKLQCGSALTTAAGALVGWSHQTWIRIA
jgi:hypothetical protein